MCGGGFKDCAIFVQWAKFRGVRTDLSLSNLCFAVEFQIINRFAHFYFDEICTSKYEVGVCTILCFGEGLRIQRTIGWLECFSGCQLLRDYMEPGHPWWRKWSKERFLPVIKKSRWSGVFLGCKQGTQYKEDACECESQERGQCQHCGDGGGCWRWGRRSRLPRGEENWGKGASRGKTNTLLTLKLCLSYHSFRLNEG